MRRVRGDSFATLARGVYHECRPLQGDGSMAPTDSLNSTSVTLLVRVQELEPQAWERFLHLYGPLVYGWCLQARLNPTDAADVMQEVFTAIFSGIREFRLDQPGSTLRGWLRVICRHKLADFFRRQATTPQAVGSAIELAAQAEAEDDPASQHAEQNGLISRAAALVRGEFEQRTWQAFWLVTVDHRPVADVAAELGMTAGAVRQAKYMVLRRLRAELSNDLE